LARRIKEIGIPEEKVIVLPSGTDIKRFNLKRKNEIREKLSIEDQKIVLFVGQLTEKKGLNSLITAIEIISKKYSNKVKFVFVGDGIFRKKIVGMKNVITKGNLSPERTADLFVAADIFVLPSLAEGRPNVIYEAMASECAIVATDIGGIPEQVRNGYNGILVEPRNAKMLAEKISYLLNDEDEMVRMGKNGRKRIIEEGWTWEGYAKRVKGIYQDVL